MIELKQPTTSSVPSNSEGNNTPAPQANAVVNTNPFAFDHNAVNAKIKSIRTFLQSFIGKPGYNSFYWTHKHLKPLEDRLNKGEETKELQDAILALKQTEPIVHAANVVNPPREAQAAGGGVKEGMEGLRVGNVQESL